MSFRNTLPALIALFAPAAAEAAAPALVPITGFLTDDAGAPIDGPVDITFKIYRTPTGNQSVWNNNNQPMSVDVSAGQFTAYLGSDAALDLALFRDNQTLYLGMAVEGGAEMTPRLEIGAAPYAGYAQYSEDANALGGHTWDEFRLSSTDILWSDLDPTTLPNGLANGDDVGPTYVAGNGIAIAPNGSNQQISADQATIEGWARGVAYDSPTELTSALDSIYLRKQTCATNQVLMYDGTGNWTCTDTTALPLSESVIDGFVNNNGYASTTALSSLTTRVGTAETNITSLQTSVGTMNTTLTGLQTQVTGLAGNPGNMLAQYELDENSGSTTFVDTSGLGNNLTGSLGAVIAGSGTAHSTRSVAFSGAQGLIAASGNKIADTSQVDAEMWLNTTNSGLTYTLLEKQGAWKMRLVGGKVEWTVTTVGGTCTITHSTTLANNAWYKVEGSYDGLAAVVVVNGAGQSVPCTTGTIPSTYGGVMTVGGKITGTTWSEVLNGNIDEVRIRPTGRQDSTNYRYASTFPGSVIASASEQALVNDWVVTYDGRRPKSWTLCYRKSTNGASSATFHSLCDGRGPNVTFFSTSTSKRLGAFNPYSWTSGFNEYVGASGRAFLFSLTAQHVYPSARNYETYNNNGYGPTFGNGHDIYVDSGMTNGYCNFPYSYSYPPSGWIYPPNNTANQELCGVNVSGNPVFNEIEVYYATY